MKTAVVLSTFNGQNFIKQQLDSLRLQEHVADEVLILDDRSTDDTVTIVKKYIEEFSLENKWKLVVNQQNKGWQKNFIDGIDMATGDLIFTCDQDDIWRVDKIKVCHDLMEKNKVSLLVSNYCEFFSNGKEKIGPNKNTKELKKVDISMNYMLVGYPGCTYCFTKDLARLAIKYWTIGEAHDALLWRLGLFSDSLYVYTDDLIKWRKHNDSAFAKNSLASKTIANKLKWIENSIHNCKLIVQYLDNDVVRPRSRYYSIVQRNLKWLKLRKEFYRNKSIFSWLKLLFYFDCYPRKRQYLGDFYLVFVKRS